MNTYDMIMGGPIEAAIATKQLSDDAVMSLLSQRIVSRRLVYATFMSLQFTAIAIVWWRAIKNQISENKEEEKNK